MRQAALLGRRLGLTQQQVIPCASRFSDGGGSSGKTARSSAGMAFNKAIALQTVEQAGNGQRG
ncbi:MULTISPECIES: hypothetical protein [unclassified Raoultella]|uniref:hypothetical protein n=1 Tax=unclassified Raoultella TaxID=2627600 RepID=UPI00190F62A8|nr:MULTISPECIES: hypothetical protein [unclassified Raoultella]